MVSDSLARTALGVGWNVLILVVMEDGLGMGGAIVKHFSVFKQLKCLNHLILLAQLKQTTVLT